MQVTINCVSAIFYFTATTKALEHNAPVIPNPLMERIIILTAPEGSIRVKKYNKGLKEIILTEHNLM